MLAALVWTLNDWGPDEGMQPSRVGGQFQQGGESVQGIQQKNGMPFLIRCRLIRQPINEGMSSPCFFQNAWVIEAFATLC